MENIGRRSFIKKSIAFLASSLIPRIALCSTGKVSLVLPEKPFEVYEKEGRIKGPCVLIIGGIHGNEPGGYKAVDMLVDVDVIKGKLILVPRANFTSILANVRGYNGDMNRKFIPTPPPDPDYPFVEAIKRLILRKDVDYILSLHDGYGFCSLNPRRWGQCVVIDEKVYHGMDLYKFAEYVVKRVNRRLRTPHYRFPIKITNTFHENTLYPEQRKSLTYFALKEGKKPAFCLEVSKNIPYLVTKIIHHLLLIHYFLEAFGLKLSPSPSDLIKYVRKYLRGKNAFSVELEVGGKRFAFNRGDVVKVRSGDVIKITKVDGGRGVFVAPSYGSFNAKRITFRREMGLLVKRDSKNLTKIRFMVG